MLLRALPRRQVWWGVAGSLFWIGLGSSTIALGPLALREIVNELTLRSFNGAAIFIGLYIGSIWISRATTAAQTFSFGKQWRVWRKTLAGSIYQRMLTLSYRFYIDRRTGTLVQIVGDGLAGLRSILTALNFGIIPAIIQGATITAVFMYIERFDLLLFLLVFCIIYGTLFFRGTDKRAEIQRKAMASDGETAGLATETLAGHEISRLYGSQELVRGKLDGAYTNSKLLWDSFARSLNANQQVLALFFALAMCCLLFFTAYQVASGSLTPGDFVLANSYLFQVVAPVERLSFFSRDIIQGLGNLERLSVILDEKTEQELNASSLPLNASGPLDVVVDGVSFGYEPGRAVLQNVSLHLKPGKIVAIVGPSGSGKSTLWRLMCHLFRSDRGRILVNGISTQDLDLSSLRRAIAVVPQETFLYNGSILDNIWMSRPESTRDEVLQAGKRAKLDAFVESLPAGWDTIVGERGVRLSGGEKQRVAIARAILRKPRLIILDEATSALDSETESSINSSLSAACENASAIVVAHRLSTIQHADEIIVLESGRIVEQGSHGPLLAKRGRYAEMWAAQMQKSLRN